MAWSARALALLLVLALAAASPSSCEGKEKASAKCPGYEMPDPRDRLDRQTRWIPDPDGVDALTRPIHSRSAWLFSSC